MAQLPNTNTTNKVLFDSIRALVKLSNKTDVKVWKAVARVLSGPASQRAEVNLNKIEKNASEGENVIIPGKVLATGTFTKKKVTIVAFGASESAIAKIEAAGSKFVEIREYVSAKKVDAKVKILA